MKPRDLEAENSELRWMLNRVVMAWLNEPTPLNFTVAAAMLDQWRGEYRTKSVRRAG